MRIGLLFHKDPLVPANGIDLVRLRALSEGLYRLGAHVSVVAPVLQTGSRLGSVPVLPLDVLTEKGRFDIIKASYHSSVELLGEYDGPLVCRLVRVIDEFAPERDTACRERLLTCQEIVRRRAYGVVFNNHVNVQRWRDRYGTGLRAAVIPTGCPSVLPPLGPSPYAGGKPPLLFLGSVASQRMAEMLNEAAERLEGLAEIHFVGRNKTSLYGGRELALSHHIVAHGEVDEDATWTFAHHARLGLALAAGPDIFDNDLSKIVAYLRAGLPVLAEERLANAGLIDRFGLGAVFRYGDSADLARWANTLLQTDFGGTKPAAMAWMASRYSWGRRAAVLLRFCKQLIA